MVLFADHHEVRLRTLLDELPELKAQLRTILHMGYVSLGDLLEAGVYHPEFKGSFDLSSVGQALVPELFDQLPDIQTPSQAAAAYRRIAKPRVRTTTRKALAESILEYASWRCRMLMELYQMLSR